MPDPGAWSMLITEKAHVCGLEVHMKTFILVGSSKWFDVAVRHFKTHRCCVNSNGTTEPQHCGTKPSPGQMLTNNKRCSVSFAWGQFYNECSRGYSVTYFWKLHFLNYYHFQIPMREMWPYSVPSRCSTQCLLKIQLEFLSPISMKFRPTYDDCDNRKTIIITYNYHIPYRAFIAVVNDVTICWFPSQWQGMDMAWILYRGVDLLCLNIMKHLIHFWNRRMLIFKW